MVPVVKYWREARLSSRKPLQSSGGRGMEGNFQNFHVLQSFRWYYIFYRTDVWAFRNIKDRKLEAQDYTWDCKSHIVIWLPLDSCWWNPLHVALNSLSSCPVIFVPSPPFLGALVAEGVELWSNVLPSAICSAQVIYSLVEFLLLLMWFELLLGDLQSLQATHTPCLAVDGGSWYWQGIHNKSS